VSAGRSGDGGDPYAIAEEEVARHRQAPFAGMPPFAGGAVGYFGYDLVRTVEPLGEPNPDELGLPDMALMLSDVLVVFDHLRHEITIIANVYADAGRRGRRGPTPTRWRRSRRRATCSPGPVPRTGAAR
jgi:anthranilate synthase component 1